MNVHIDLKFPHLCMNCPLISIDNYDLMNLCPDCCLGYWKGSIEHVMVYRDTGVILDDQDRSMYRGMEHRIVQERPQVCIDNHGR